MLSMKCSLKWRKNWRSDFMRTVNEIKEYYKDDNLHCENPECEEASEPPYRGNRGEWKDGRLVCTNCGDIVLDTLSEQILDLWEDDLQDIDVYNIADADIKIQKEFKKDLQLLINKYKKV